MNILPHELTGKPPSVKRVKTIHTMSDADLEPLGPWRLSKLPGVEIKPLTIKDRLENQGMGKREACTLPIDRSAEWKRKC